MKKIIYYLIKNEVYNRFAYINERQAKRLICIKKARIELKKWDDIPVSWQLDSISRILQAPKGRVIIEELMFALISPQYTDEELALYMPLSWY